VPKRNSADDRQQTKAESKVQKPSKLSKEETKGQISARNAAANGTLGDLDKSSKLRISVGRNSVDNSNNGLLGNLVRVPASSRRLIDASVLWTSLPSSITKLGKVLLELVRIS